MGCTLEAGSGLHEPQKLTPIGRVNRVILGASAVAIFAMNAAMIWNVISRYGFGAPTSWGIPVVAYLILFTVFLGAAGTLERDEHVRVTILVDLLPDRIGRWLLQIGDLLGIVFVIVLSWQTFLLYLSSLASGARDTSMLRIPLSWTQWILVTGSILLLITYVAVWVQRVRERR